MTADPATPRARALRLLAMREHSRQELARKLHARGYQSEAIEPVLDALTVEGLLSEPRLVETYVAERLGKGFGPLRIRQELRDKGLAEAAIAPHLDLDDATLLAQLRAVAAKRFGSDPPATRAELAKRARFLEYRGFPAHLIARVLDLD